MKKMKGQLLFHHGVRQRIIGHLKPCKEWKEDGDGTARRARCPRRLMYVVGKGNCIGHGKEMEVFTTLCMDGFLDTDVFHNPVKSGPPWKRKELFQKEYSLKRPHLPLKLKTSDAFENPPLTDSILKIAPHFFFQFLARLVCVDCVW